jgi:K+-sensing histidine kinase KdpD
MSSGRRCTRIFDPFASFWPANRTGSSTGLGLSVVRSLVADHDGSVEVTDAAAWDLAGAAFIVRLPVVAEQPPAASGSRGGGVDA